MTWIAHFSSPKVLLYFQVQTLAPTKDNTSLYHQNGPKKYHHQGRPIEPQEDQFLRRIQYSHPRASMMLLMKELESSMKIEGGLVWYIKYISIYTVYT